MKNTQKILTCMWFVTQGPGALLKKRSNRHQNEWYAELCRTDSEVTLCVITKYLLSVHSQSNHVSEGAFLTTALKAWLVQKQKGKAKKAHWDSAETKKKDLISLLICTWIVAGRIHLTTIHLWRGGEGDYNLQSQTAGRPSYITFWLGNPFCLGLVTLVMTDL